MKIRKFADAGYVDGEDGNQYRDYDPDKMYSGRFTDDETGGLAENTPTRSTAKAAPSRASAARARARAVPARAAATATPVASTSRLITNDAKAAKAPAASELKQKTVSANDPLEVFTPAARARRAKELQEAYAALDREAGKTSRNFKKGGDIMESKKMMGKEVAFMKKKGAPSSMIKHEEKESKSMKFGLGGGMPPPSGARPDPRMMAAMMAARQQPMRRPPPGGMPPPAQPPMGMKAGGKVKRYDDGGNISKEDVAAFGMPTAQKIQENRAENKGYLEGQNKYPAEARLQKDLAVPARIARKTGVYLNEKYGDVKGNVKGMLGNREALRELRGSQLSREAALGYKKGGMAYAKGGGIESRGKTKGTVIRMAAGGSVSSRADGIAQRGKTKFTNY